MKLKSFLKKIIRLEQQVDTILYMLLKVTTEDDDDYGTNNIEKMKGLVEKDFWVKKELRKHRYVYLLGSKNEKRTALKNLKHPLFPYPKTADIVEPEVIKINVRS